MDLLVGVRGLVVVRDETKAEKEDGEDATKAAVRDCAPWRKLIVYSEVKRNREKGKRCRVLCLSLQTTNNPTGRKKG